MNIGFDAKRAFLNETGLGHYSRTLVSSLAQGFPGHEYFLFTPKTGPLYQPLSPNIHTVLPQGFPYNKLTALWRSSGVKKDLLRLGIDIYHGLSHEIPNGIQHTGVASVVTMHDLIFERYPKQFSAIDVRIYRKKFSYACRHANKVIAISQQTADDLMAFYKVPAEKIRVCYQGCHPSFYVRVAEEKKLAVKKHYQLPDRFLLSVGSIIERKMLLSVCQALQIVPEKDRLPLVVIGSGGSYKKTVQQYLKESGLEKWVIFLNDTPAAMDWQPFKTAEDFPAIYQLAEAVVYTSIFEGWGIPVLEAMASGVPVITSHISSMPEVGGNAVLYANPYQPATIADAIIHLYNNAAEKTELGRRGQERAQLFKSDKCAAKVMEVYHTLG